MVFLLVLTALSSAESAASSSTSPSVETIVVTASRVEQRLDEAAIASTVIGRGEIVSSGARNLAEALEAVGGLRIVPDVTGASQVRLRGFDTDQVLVLVDGQRVAGRKNGAVDLTRIGVERIERVEVVKGPGSAVYGADALGGVVNVITRRPSGALEGDLRLSGGASPASELSAETAEAAGRIGGRIGAGFDWQAVASLRQRGSYDLDPSTPSTSGSALRDGDAELSGQISGDGWRLRVRLDGGLREIEGIDSVTLPRGFRIDDRAQRVRTLGVHVAPEVDVLGGRLRVDGSASVYDETFVRAQRGGEALDRDTLTDTLGQLGLQYDRLLGLEHHLLIGSELLFQSVQATRYPGFDERVRVALFAQDEWKPLEALGVLAGVRVDYDDQFGTFPTPRVALRWRPLDLLMLRASWGLGYKAPLPRDLGIYFENPSAGYRVEGNPDLDPETASTFSASVHLRPGSRLRFDVELYQSDVENLIVPLPGMQPEPGDPLVFTYGNVEAARLRGLEAHLTWSPVGGLRLRAGYEALEARDLARGRVLPDRPPHRLTAGVGVAIPEVGLDLSLQGAWTDARTFFITTPSGEEVAESAEPFVRLDARGELELTPEFAAFVGADNLLDAGDPSFLAIPPRTIFGGIQSRFR